MAQQSQSQQDWIVRADNGQERHCGSRSEAQRIKQDMEELGVEVEIITPPTETATAPEVVDAEEATERLPDRNMTDDPLDWIPAPFVDDIQGVTVLNRKGFEVLYHHYDISVQSEIIVPPEETDFEFCRAKATATTPDGVAYEAHGSAHIDRDDDPTLLLELADTRACKRAASAATGVGAVAVEELKNDVEGGV